MKLAATQMLKKHKNADTAPTDKTIIKRETRKLDRLQKKRSNCATF
ncbi:MAG: hypothetical protein ABIR84_13050 [Candidatus Nitrotoga sp.]